MTCALSFMVSLTYLLEDFSQMIPPTPLTLAPQVTVSYINGVLPHVFLP